jgi:DNA topoisomerase-1
MTESAKKNPTASPKGEEDDDDLSDDSQSSSSSSDSGNSSSGSNSSESSNNSGDSSAELQNVLAKKGKMKNTPAAASNVKSFVSASTIKPQAQSTPPNGRTTTASITTTTKVNNTPQKRPRSSVVQSAVATDGTTNDADHHRENDEETLLQRCKRLRRHALVNKANEERAKEEMKDAVDPMKDYKPKRPPMISLPSDIVAIDAKITKLRAQINKMESEKRMKDDSKTVSLGTSKVNYIDPRIVCAWCTRHSVPVEKVFNKSLIKKFPWALEIDPRFRFDRTKDPTAGTSGNLRTTEEENDDDESDDDEQ